MVGPRSCAAVWNDETGMLASFPIFNFSLLILNSVSSTLGLMETPTPDPELLRSLGKLARGLSALFWGLPAVLLISAETLRAEFLEPLEIAPALVANLVLLFGLWRMESFQKQERPWRHALDRAKLLGLVNFGLCPFLFWFNRMPGQSYFQAAIFLLVISSLLFLFNLNLVLRYLGAMLPDETLRHDINQFTWLNRRLLIAWLVFALITIALSQLEGFPLHLDLDMMLLMQQSGVIILLILGLSPLAITMGLIWKTKEVILDSVFAAK